MDDGPGTWVVADRGAVIVGDGMGASRSVICPYKCCQGISWGQKLCMRAIPQLDGSKLELLHVEYQTLGQ